MSECLLELMGRAGCRAMGLLGRGPGLSVVPMCGVGRSSEHPHPELRGHLGDVWDP